jgi:phospholipase/carboxylesterase
MKEIIIDSKLETKKIIFLFHGYGANKENLSQVGEMLAEHVPDAKVHIPDGIEQCNEGIGFQWFSFVGSGIDINKKDFYANRDIIESYIRGVINGKNLNLKDVCLSGFSQGGMISIALGLSIGVGKIISFSGLLLDNEVSIADKNTKILMTHGLFDNVVPIQCMYNSEKILRQRGMDVKVVTSEVEHYIDNNALTEAINFLNL